MIILLTEQASARILALDTTEDWSAAEPKAWSWQPPETGNAARWGLPNDVRLRDTPQGQRLLVSDSSGLIAMIAYPEGGRPLWAVDLGPDANPHGIELLPGGLIAVAASSGNFVRLYPATDHRPRYASAELADAHQVLWDDPNKTLWAIGRRQLVGYATEGTAARPRLKRRVSHRLPTTGGHDLQPVPQDPDKLWVTTMFGVHQFTKSTGRFDEDFRWSDTLYRSRVKSIGTDPVSGWVLQTRPKSADGSRWWTDRVDLFVGSRRRRSLILPGSRIYRARWAHPAGN